MPRASVVKSGTKPLKPFPPNCQVCWFQTVGTASANSMFGAFGSTGLMIPRMKQCSGTTLFLMAIGPVPGSSVAAVTTAPLVGNAIADAGIVLPAIAAHAILGLIPPATGGTFD